MNSIRRSDIRIVDIHSHILFGIDDGPRTLQDSLGMLELAVLGGTSDIVATPHSDLRFRLQPDVIAEQISVLQTEMGNRIRIHRGCDFHLHFDNIQACLVDRTNYTINGLRYLMVEFSEASIPKAIENVFEDMLARGITPVITHPERNHLLMKSVEDLAQWIRLGCLVQVTGQSLLGRFGRSAEAGAKDLINRRMVHFVASDAHDVQHRPPDLRAPYAFVVSEWDEAMAVRLFERNPAATLTGEEIEYEDPEGQTEKRSRWKFW